MYTLNFWLYFYVSMWRRNKHTLPVSVSNGPLKPVPGVTTREARRSILLSQCRWKLMMRYWHDTIRRSAGAPMKDGERGGKDKIQPANLASLSADLDSGSDHITSQITDPATLWSIRKQSRLWEQTFTEVSSSPVFSCSFHNLRPTSVC